MVERRLTQSQHAPCVGTTPTYIYKWPTRPAIVCVSEIKFIFIQLHPAQIGYDSIWVSPAFICSLVLSPKVHFPAVARSFLGGELQSATPHLTMTSYN